MWSFKALGKGLHPSTDPDGKPLEKGSLFFDNAGKSLHPKGYRAYVWPVLGDQEFFCNVLKLPHWASHFRCWECDAENFSDCTPGKEYKEICLEKQKFTVASHAERLADPWSNHGIF